MYIQIVIEKTGKDWLVETTRDGVPFWASRAVGYDDLFAAMVQDAAVALDVSPNPERIAEEIRIIWEENKDRSDSADASEQP